MADQRYVCQKCTILPAVIKNESGEFRCSGCWLEDNKDRLLTEEFRKGDKKK